MQHDVIIVGAGHNGLTAAAYLAKAGKKVLVLEHRDVVGGCAVTEEVDPGEQAAFEDNDVVAWWSDEHEMRAELQRIAPDDIDRFLAVERELRR